MTNPATILAVEAVLAVPFLLIGLSHLVQPKMWKDFFIGLANRGTEGVLLRTFLFELWPAGAIVALHQDWSLPGGLVTLYGHLLMLKVTLSLLVPRISLKSLEQAERVGDWAFVPAGLVLMLLGAVCVWNVAPTLFA